MFFLVTRYTQGGEQVFRLLYFCYNILPVHTPTSHNVKTTVSLHFTVLHFNYLVTVAPVKEWDRFRQQVNSHFLMHVGNNGWSLWSEKIYFSTN